MWLKDIKVFVFYDFWEILFYLQYQLKLCYEKNCLYWFSYRFYSKRLW